jgi:predicted kinase
MENDATIAQNTRGAFGRKKNNQGLGKQIQFVWDYLRQPLGCALKKGAFGIYNAPIARTDWIDYLVFVIVASKLYSKI